MPDKNEFPNYVIGPRGTILTPANLPLPRTDRWVKSRKAEVVFAVSGGLLSFDDACARYQLTAEEFLSWQRQIDTPQARTPLKSIGAKPIA